MICEKTRTPTMEWVMEQMDDENKANRMYCEYGFPDIAEDEARHRRILQEFLFKQHAEGAKT
jgi:hypothetical protein